MPLSNTYEIGLLNLRTGKPFVKSFPEFIQARKCILKCFKSKRVKVLYTNFNPWL